MIYPTAKIRVSESNLLIYSFILRHKIPKTTVDDLLKLINFHTPAGVTTVSSRYKLMKNLNFNYDASSVHLYCPTCEEYLGNKLRCIKCDSEFNKTDLIDKGSFFFSFEPKEMLMDVLKNPVVSLDLRRNILKRKAEPSADIQTILDGKQYQLLNLKENDFTCLLNTDGVPVFKSSKFSLWPILSSINELEYGLGRKYILTLGLWFGSSKPNFHTFLEPFVKIVKDLSAQGIKCMCGKEEIHSYV